MIAAFLALWDGAPTNKVVGGLFPNDADGNAWGDPKLGLVITSYSIHYTKLYDSLHHAPRKAACLASHNICDAPPLTLIFFSLLSLAE